MIQGSHHTTLVHASLHTMAAIDAIVDAHVTTQATILQLQQDVDLLKQEHIDMQKKNTNLQRQLVYMHQKFTRLTQRAANVEERELLPQRESEDRCSILQDIARRMEEISQLEALWEKKRIADDILRVQEADIQCQEYIVQWVQYPLHQAAWDGAPHVVVDRLLRHYKYNIDAVGPRGNTPLHRAACNGHMHTVIQLVKSGADVNAKTSDGHTALHYATIIGHHLMITHLLKRCGAKVNARDNQQQTPLQHAVTHCNDEVVALLQLHGGIL